MFPLIVMSKEPTFIMTLMMANIELRRKDMEDSYDNLYSLSYPYLKSNSLDKKSLKRTLRSVIKMPRVVLYNQWLWLKSGK